MSKGYSPIKTGYDPRKDGEGGAWFSMKPGDAVDVTVLVEAKEIISYEQCAIWLEDGKSPVWVYTGPEDPSHELGVEKRFRSCLPVLVDGEAKVWSMGKRVHGQILEIADAGGPLKGSVLRIKRTGTGLTTQYSVVPRGKRSDVSKIEEVDVVEMLGLKTPEEIRQMLAERFGKSSYEEFLASYKGRKGKSKYSPKEEKDEELEEVDSLELV